MTDLHDARYHPAGSPHPVAIAARRAAGGAIAGLSLLLARLARHLAEPPREACPGERHTEYHADAGAPEGALYVDGKLVGWLEGIRRL